MSDLSKPLEEEISDILLDYFGYKIEPWEAEELASKIVGEINSRLSTVLE